MLAHFDYNRDLQMTIAASLERRRFAVLCLVCVLTCIGCGSKPAETGTSQSRLPFGATDIPHPAETLRGTVPVGGWALSEDGIDRVAIYVDRSYVLTATLGGARPDVAKIYGSLPNAATSGFNALLDTSSFPPGNHEIVVQAHSKGGAYRDIAVISVVFAKPGP